MASGRFKQLQHIFDAMDTAWDKAAAAYDFQCSGCEDNCCTSLFYHHSFIEKAYLLYGFEQLEQPVKQAVLERAEHYCRKTFSDNPGKASLKIMCPVNENGRCLLYRFRPMICRLHGIPHEMIRPDGTIIKGPGCRAGRFETKPYIPFDRTGFYRQMAQAEIEFRNRFNKNMKLKETVAQMLLSI